MPITALPKHLQENLYPQGDHTDHDNSFQKWFSRAWDAYGPNATEGDDGFITLLPIPFTSKRIVFPFPIKGKWRSLPRLLIGRNVTRWVSRNDKSILELPSLKGRWIFWWQLKGDTIVIERQPDNELYCKVWTWTWAAILKNYGPSPIQDLVPDALQLAWPLCFGVHALGMPQKQYRPEHPPHLFHWKFVDFWGFRLFSRWDSYDDYFVCPAWYAGKGAN